MQIVQTDRAALSRALRDMARRERWNDDDKGADAREAAARKRRGSEAPREFIEAFDTYMQEGQ